MNSTQVKEDAQEAAAVLPKTNVLPWDLILIYVLLKSFQGEGRLSFLFSIQNLMWIPIAQHVTLNIQVTMLNFVYLISLWHFSDCNRLE